MREFDYYIQHRICNYYEEYKTNINTNLDFQIHSVIVNTNNKLLLKLFSRIPINSF